MNFALILFVLLLITGALYAVDVLKCRKLRAKWCQGAALGRVGSQFFPGHPDRFRVALLSV
jgi:signal peptidase I